MANNHCTFSTFLVARNQAERDWLAQQLEDRTDEESLRTLPRFLIDGRENPNTYDGMVQLGEDVDCAGFQWEFTTIAGQQGLWIHADEHGVPNNVAYLVQQFLIAWQPEGCFGMGYAFTCDKPRVDEFGGGAFFVTATKEYWMDTYAFVDEHVSAHKPKDAEYRRNG